VTDGLVVVLGGADADVAGRGVAEALPVAVLPGAVQAGPVLRVASVGVVPVAVVPVAVVPADVAPAAAGQRGPAGDQVSLGAAGDCAVPGPPPCGRWPGSPGSAGV
jgi:hypothetical protein